MQGTSKRGSGGVGNDDGDSSSGGGGYRNGGGVGGEYVESWFSTGCSICVRRKRSTPATIVAMSILCVSLCMCLCWVIFLARM